MWGNKEEKGPKLIAVMGATGAQGGSVVRAFHAAGTDAFEVRAISRNPDSEKAQAIKPLVKEIVQANADDEDAMVKAFKGCYGAFVVTNFWEDMDMNHEMEQTKTIQAQMTSSFRYEIIHVTFICGVQLQQSHLLH